MRSGDEVNHRSARIATPSKSSLRKFYFILIFPVFIQSVFERKLNNTLFISVYNYISCCAQWLLQDTFVRGLTVYYTHIFQGAKMSLISYIFKPF